MLARRRFVACAICAATGLTATGVAAQPTGGVKRTILSRTDFPGDTYATIEVLVEIEGGATVARHTHPGVESGIVIEGETRLFVQGQPDRTVKASEAFQIPPGVPHSVRNGPARTRVAVTYVVEKDKPLASPAPE
ncbi:Cupin domain-containing protein [Rhodovastum atsumiense]|uniref:Cupin domain-containing protein n=1 Tax=Rhodovastum atsumiense TaxID=504468 RepID=A0A5M6J0S8_9PROT|nr:cupin domain-containing protein [Rhodovastum atsumiense]KAA5613218.1 cupin domain-containing protein [Rhodovastum atsumiense]CAH2600628.1 Cupin domain-containing protein [Rhodovastum atsumiense]